MEWGKARVPYIVFALQCKTVAWTKNFRPSDIVGQEQDWTHNFEKVLSPKYERIMRR